MIVKIKQHICHIYKVDGIASANLITPGWFYPGYKNHVMYNFNIKGGQLPYFVLPADLITTKPLLTFKWNNPIPLKNLRLLLELCNDTQS